MWQHFGAISTNTTPATIAMIWLSVINYMNIFSMIIVVNYFYKLRFLFANRNKFDPYTCAFVLLVMLANYFLLYKKREQIAEKYKHESRNMRILGMIVLYIYQIGSFIFVYILSQIFPVI